MPKDLQRRGRTHTTKWNLLFQYSSIALAMTSGVLMVPLYLNYIPSDIYGAWLATGNILAWITSIDPGLAGVLQQKIAVAYGKQDYKSIHSLISAGGMISIVIALTIYILGITASYFLASWLNLSPSIDIKLITSAFNVAVSGSALMIMSYSIVSICQGLQSSLGIGLIFVTVNILSIVLSIILLYQGFGVFAIAISLVFRGLGTSLGFGTYLVWRLSSEEIGFVFRLNELHSLLKLISYSFLSRFGSIVTNNIDSFIAARFIGVEAVAPLSFTKRIPEISKPFLERPVIAFMPSISHLIGAGEIDKARDVLLRLLRYVSWGLGLVTAGFFSFNQDFIRLWIGEKFFAGHDINFFVCMGLVISVISSCFGNLCFSMGNIKGNSFISFIQSILYVPLVVFGTIHFGLIGVVAAPVISTLLTSFWYFPMSFMKIMKIPIDSQKIIFWDFSKVAVITILLTSIFSTIEIFNWTSFVLYTVAFGTSYCLLLGLIAKEFRSELKIVLKRIRLKT